jgi:head-tail adaptor
MLVLGTSGTLGHRLCQVLGETRAVAGAVTKPWPRCAEPWSRVRSI